MKTQEIKMNVIKSLIDFMREKEIESWKSTRKDEEDKKKKKEDNEAVEKTPKKED